MLMIWNHNNFDNYLASRLYRIKVHSKDQSNSKDETAYIKPTKYCNFVEYLIDSMPDYLKCISCKKTRKM